MDGEERRIGPGDRVVISAGTPHGFHDAAEEAHLLVTVRPALELERYFRAFLGLSRDGRIRMPTRGLPRPLLVVGILMHRYRREIAAPGLPLWLQRPMWRFLALTRPRPWPPRVVSGVRRALAGLLLAEGDLVVKRIGDAVSVGEKQANRERHDVGARSERGDRPPRGSGHPEPLPCPETP